MVQPGPKGHIVQIPSRTLCDILHVKAPVIFKLRWVKSTASCSRTAHQLQMQTTRELPLRTNQVDCRAEQPTTYPFHCDGRGPFSFNQIAPKDGLKITKGSPRIYTYTAASGRPINWS